MTQTAERIRAIDSVTEDCRRAYYERDRYDQDAELERLERLAEYRARNGGEFDGRE